MPKGFCRYCDEPFAGDPTVGHPSHMERDCRDEIDGHLRRAVTGLAFPDQSEVESQEVV